jgi:putative NADH-flavin reductase
MTMLAYVCRALQPCAFFPWVTGKSGQEVYRLAIAAGHEVTCIVRNPEVAVQKGLLLATAHLVKGNVFNPASFSATASSADVVSSVLGQRGLDPLAIYSTALPRCVEVLSAAGVKRFVIVTSDHDG